MKCSMKWLLFVLVLVAGIPIASAYTISSSSVSPTGDLTPGTTVSVSVNIVFSGSGDETFPMDDTLILSTDLDDPDWNVVLVLNDIDNTQPVENAKSIELTGWVLSYDPDDVDESLRVTLTGTAPSVSTTADKAMIEITELDSKGYEVSGATLTISRKVINTGEVTSAISARTSDLGNFRISIDEKYSLGVDTTEAEAKYSAAQSAINSAKSQPATGYSAAIASLTSAQQLITDGETLLDKAWALKEIEDAQVPITKTDALIVWLKPNATSGDYKVRLSEISTKREIAAGYISTANDEVDSGSYERARSKADEAFTKGNESYTDALALKKELSSGFNPLAAIGSLFKSSFLIIVVVILVIVGAVGYVIYKKRTQWDELG